MTAPASPPRDGVDAVIAAAVATADRDLAGASRPAFAGVVARAHRQDPAQIPRAWLTVAGAPPPAHTLDADADPRRARPTARDADTAPRRATPTPARDADPDPRRRAWVLFTLTAAAIVLLAFGVQRAVGRHEAASAFQAGAQPSPPPTTSPEHPRPPPARTAPELTPPAPIDPPATRDPAAVEPAARAREPRESLDDLLARLDDEAEARMHAGDLTGADDRYQQIVARGGRRVQVELAFSDRFHLARRRDDEPALRKLWTAYLDRFPRGQFADDARGGLCRLAPASTRAACWRDYLADFPSGSFAVDARAAGDAP